MLLSFVKSVVRCPADPRRLLNAEVFRVFSFLSSSASIKVEGRNCTLVAQHHDRLAAHKSPRLLKGFASITDLKVAILELDHDCLIVYCVCVALQLDRLIKAEQLVRKAFEGLLSILEGG